MKDQKYFAVNWTDGVKITKDHFLTSYYHSVDAIRDYAATEITSYNYGLLGTESEDVKSLEVEARTLTNERMVLELKACNAITSKGVRIVFFPEMYGGNLPVATVDATHIDTNDHLDFYVVVTVNPFHLIPVGEPDPEVIPLHHPHVLPKIDLHIVPESQFNHHFLDKYFLIVGKAQWKSGAFTLDKEYIPPVRAIRYHTGLHAFYKQVCQVLTGLKSYSITINDKNRTKYESNKLAKSTFVLCSKVLDFISQHQFYFNQLGAEQSPVFIAEKISILAHYLSNELALMKRSEKEEILQYYYEWTDVKPSVFEAALGGVIEFKYNHLEIAEMVTKMDYLMAILNQLWKKLSELEYIGQRKENIVISEENLTLKNPKKGRSWSIID